MWGRPRHSVMGQHRVRASSLPPPGAAPVTRCYSLPCPNQCQAQISSSIVVDTDLSQPRLQRAGYVALRYPSSQGNRRLCERAQVSVPCPAGRPHASGNDLDANDTPPDSSKHGQFTSKKENEPDTARHTSMRVRTLGGIMADPAAHRTTRSLVAGSGPSLRAHRARRCAG